MTKRVGRSTGAERFGGHCNGRRLSSVPLVTGVRYCAEIRLKLLIEAYGV